MSEVRDLKSGTIVKFSDFVWSKPLPESDKWGVMIEAGSTVGVIFPDAMIFMRDVEGNWHSKIMHVSDDDQFEIIDESGVPEDIPDDFWPLAARYKLLGGGDA